ncbi:MAG: hypothetical protein GX348_11565 [Veillonellaceae bacterium]|nr:hypothetical protein [Veillonellaceae bacterium]
MSRDIDKQDLSDCNDPQHSIAGNETERVDEITIVIRGGKVVKFEQRLVAI